MSFFSAIKRNLLQAFCQDQRRDLAGYYLPTQLGDMEDSKRILVDASLLYQSLEHLKLADNCESQSKAEELDRCLEDAKLLFPEGRNVSRIRMEAGQLKHFLGAARNLPAQSFMMEVR